MKIILRYRFLSELYAQFLVGNWIAVRRTLIKLVLKFINILLLPMGLFLTLIIRVISPFFLVRINVLISERIGHYATNTELYLCERDAGINVPRKPHIDLWYNNWPICNSQLGAMWARILHVGPRWLLGPVDLVNSFFPGGATHQINPPGIDRNNFLERFPAHLWLLPDEDVRGEAALRDLGIPDGAPFVCLHIRDNGYLKKMLPWRQWDYHDYRDCNVQNYILAAQKLVERGYYVIRMGVFVNEAMNVSHPMIIDYAVNGKRSDFMDIYLCAKCAFFVSNSTGIDAVPWALRKPIVYVDMVPLGEMSTSSSKFIATTKKHWLKSEKRFMTFCEIFDSGVARFVHSEPYQSRGIDLIESTPEEIADVVLEMEERIKGTYQTTEEDEDLQDQFWSFYPKYDFNGDLSGEIRSRVGADFLRRGGGGRH